MGADVFVVDNIVRDEAERYQAFKHEVPHVQAHADAWVTNLQQSDGKVWGISLRNHAEFCRKLEVNIKRTDAILQTTSQHLSDTDTAYRNQEQDFAARCNEIYKQLGSAPGHGKGGKNDQGGGSTTYSGAVPRIDEGEPEKPSGMATAVGEILSGAPNVAAIVDYFMHGNFGGAAGLTLIACDIFSQLTGAPNPLMEAAKHVAGDWDKVTQAGGAVKHISDWYKDLAQIMRDDAGVMSRGWTGPGADRAQSYFTKLIEAFQQSGDKLYDIGGEITGLGYGMLISCQGALGLLAQLLDLVVAIMLSSEVCAALSTTGIGAISWAAVAAEVWAAFGVWGQIAAILTTMVNAGQVFFGSMAAFLSNVFPTELIELPQGV